MDGHIVGIVEVPVAHLRFREDLPARAFDRNIQRYLEPILEYDVQHSDPRNQIAGIIDEEEHLQVLRELGLTETELLDTIRGGPYPTLRNHIVEHGDGQHRIAAAKSLGNNAIWTVALHKFTTKSPEHLSHVGYVKRRTQHCTYETPHSDGEIYLKIRSSHIAEQTEEESKWKLLLKKGKRIAVDMIFEREVICKALDDLRASQGLWTGMQLGNWHRHLALDCDDEIKNYLEKIHEVWAETFSLGDANIFAAVDVETVRTLEGRAPYACAEDRELIEEAFQSGTIFARVVNPEKRALILEKVLGYRGIVPSMRSLHENMKYFAIAVRIIRKLLLPHEFRLQRNGLPSKRRRRLTEERCELPSLQEALSKLWNDKATPFIEVSEGEFWPALGQPSFKGVYIQLFLSALRQFPLLNDEWGPRIDQGEEVAPATDPFCTWLFCRRAHLLGIQGSFACRTAVSTSLPMLVDADSGAEVVTPVDRRWGRPHTRTFRAIQQVAFLPNLLDDGASRQMCVAFVLRDFIASFMGKKTWDVPNGVDWEGRQISLANPPSQPGIALPLGDTEADEGESMDVEEATVRSPLNSTTIQHQFRDSCDGQGQGGEQCPGPPSLPSDVEMLEADCNRLSTAAVTEDMTMEDAPSNRHQYQPPSHSHGANYESSNRFSSYRSCSPVAADSDNTSGPMSTHGLQWNDVSGSDTLTTSWTSLAERDKVVDYWNGAGWQRSVGGAQLPDSRSSSLKRNSGRRDTHRRGADAWTCSGSTELCKGPSSVDSFDRVSRWGQAMGNGRSSRWPTSLPGANSPISVGRPGWGTETLASVSTQSLRSGSVRATNDRWTPLGPGRYSSHSTEDDDRLGERSRQREPLPSLSTHSRGPFFFPRSPDWGRRRNSVSQASNDDQSDLSTVPLTPPSAMALRQHQSRTRPSSVASPASHPGWGSAPQSIAWSLPSQGEYRAFYHPSASSDSRSRFAMGSSFTGSSVYEGW